MAFSAGVSAVNITPPVGVDLTGFGNRPSASVGIHDDLYARTLVLSENSTTLVLVTMDLLALGPEVVTQIREAIQERFEVPPAHVLLNCSHTHSGPATIRLRGMGNLDEDYVRMVIRKVVGGVQMAIQTRCPATFGWGRVPVQVGINRRERTSHDRVRLGVNEEGPVAAYADVLKVQEAGTGRPLTAFFSHAAHPVVLGGDNVWVSADYPGYAVAFVEQVSGCRAMFAQGCCGNINAHPRTGTFAGAERLGRILGAAVVGCLEQIDATQDGGLKAASRLIRLPFQDPLPVDQLQSLIAHYEHQVSEARAKGLGRLQVALHQGMLAWAKDMLRVATGEVELSHQPFEVQVLQIGEAAVVGLPGEVFVEYALTLDAHSPYPQTVTLGYTNGCIGYVPTAAAYAEGGYEIETAYRYYGTLMIAPESEALIQETALALLGELAESSY